MAWNTSLVILLLALSGVHCWDSLVPPGSPWYYSCHDEDLKCAQIVKNGSCLGKELQPDGSIALNVKLGR